ncbi:thioesterase family protein [Arthrobacter sp. ISL-95]|uniref:acyl-CoA thioesterase n=1 Tax=Arthrobacter sp. ISL-95 TaxID=2819116 RepID=UPI001BE620E5|nr:thioesterase family protein [Arthrobacter sp. ISL-95]MBT2588458.1 acyl-CoA thioesterase [Arthrobacter sp. ISL-95]
MRNHEVDSQGFLFNSRYLEVADVAMTEFFRSIGWPYPKLVAEGTDPSVVSAALLFKSPAYFDDILDVDVKCRNVGNSSFKIDVWIARGGTEVATVELVYVNVDPVQARSRPLPDAVALALHGALQG